MLTMNEERAYKWLVIGKTVSGAAHIRMGLPNQDAIDWFPKEGSSQSVVLAVSDGHGSPLSFRSHIGAKLAVTVALEKGQEFIEKAREIKTHMSADKSLFGNYLSLVNREAREALPREIVRSWRDRVQAHYCKNPFTPKELDSVETVAGIEKRCHVVKNWFTAYGATLLIVLVESDFIAYLQLGDGDILTVSDEGEVSLAPLPIDERLLANQTTSLCMLHAWREFRTHVQIISDDVPPALILVSTDGYSNSFKSEDDFFKVGKDILDLIRADGVQVVVEHLEDWLNESSREGSGDDISVGIICREGWLRV